MSYDGPSFDHRRRTVNFDPFKKKEKQSHQRETTSFIFKRSSHYSGLPKSIKSRRDYQNEAEKILTNRTQSSYPNLFETRRERKYRPRFRVTEVPSPMFGYTDEQKKRMGMDSDGYQEEIEWNYKALKDLMLKREYDFILFEECVTNSVLRDWQTSP